MPYCLICDNTGEVCDVCGESESACDCPRFRDEDVDPDTPIATFSPCPNCSGELEDDAPVIPDSLMLTIAIKLYARARKISIDDAEDNVRDAAMMTLEAEGRQEAAPKPHGR